MEIVGLENVFFDGLGVNIKIPDDDYSSIFKEFCIELSTFLGFAPTSEGKSHKNYNNALIWDNDIFKIFLNYGGSNSKMGAFLEVKGYDGCNKIADFFNSLDIWKWTLTRADLTLDYLGGKPTFSYLDNLIMQFASDKNITHVNTQGDWKLEVRGRTLYVGSPNSDYKIILYEKSEEQIIDKGNKDYPEGVVRVEVRYKPNNKIRKNIKRLIPCEVLAFNRNLTDLFGRLCSTAIEHVRVPKVLPKSDLDKINYAVDQYYSILSSFVADYGIKKLIKVVIKRFRTNQALRGESEAQT